MQVNCVHLHSYPYIYYLESRLSSKENAHGSITLLLVLVLLLLLLLPDNIDNTDGSSVARTPPQVSPARTHTHTREDH